MMLATRGTYLYMWTKGLKVIIGITEENYKTKRYLNGGRWRSQTSDLLCVNVSEAVLVGVTADCVERPT